MRAPNCRRGARLLTALFVASAIGAAVVWWRAAAAATPAAVVVDLESLTWTELRDRMAAGSTTVLIPIGGVEQSGPHIALGKHNQRVKVIAGRIALRLGNAVVAPTVAYVPEGAIEPPEGHMRFAGTISIPNAAFEAVLEGAARSFRQHGFREIVFLGDHGGYQTSLERVATKLNREWSARAGTKVLALVDYYRAAQIDFAQTLKARGFSADEIGSHAGLADTSLMLAIDPSMVRIDALARAAKAGSREGVSGDPQRASAELGQIGIDRQIERSVQVIREAVRAR